MGGCNSKAKVVGPVPAGHAAPDSNAKLSDEVAVKRENSQKATKSNQVAPLEGNTETEKAQDDVNKSPEPAPMVENEEGKTILQDSNQIASLEENLTVREKIENEIGNKVESSTIVLSKEEDNTTKAEMERILRLNKSRMKQNRTVRVFVSSTFRDFALERDYLMRHALPQLRKIGESRGVTVVFVDLRWGVTSEESSSGAVVKLCLQEIDACRPFFVGMLGERYGWHLDPTRQDDLLEKTMDIGQSIYPWVEKFRDRSVTELEMLHGALLQPELAGHTTFYFRNHTEFMEQMSHKIPENDRKDYESESEHAKRGQDRLKVEIAEKFPSQLYQYSNVKELSEKLVEDISQAIEKEFPINTEAFTVWDAVTLHHEAFAASKRMGYVPSSSVYDEVDSVIKCGKNIAVTGPSGLGKSALLANWILHYEEGHPQSLSFIHFIGCTTESTDYFHIIRRMIFFFCRNFDINLRDFADNDSSLRRKALDDDELIGPESIVTPRTAEHQLADLILSLKETKITEIFPDFLVTVAERSKERGVSVVIILDGLDQLEDKANAHTLFWLPPVPGLQYVCSIKQVQTSPRDFMTRPSERGLKDLKNQPSENRIDTRALAAGARRKSQDDGKASCALRYWAERGWDCWTIFALEPEEQRKVIVNYLAEHAKKLDEKQINMVLRAEPAQNPLFLRTLLDEARLFGNFFQLTQHLETLLGAKTNPDLYIRVISRMAEECGQALTLWSVGLILCSRDGITDQELREVLSSDLPADCPELQNNASGKLAWFKIKDDNDVRLLTQLLFGIREQLSSTSGFLRLFHDAVKEAVYDALGADSAAVLLHRRLAQYFGSITPRTHSLSAEDFDIKFHRQLREYPFHLAASSQFEKLAEFLSFPQVARAMLSDEGKKYELVSYWMDIERAWTESCGNLSETEQIERKDPLTNRPTKNVESYLLCVAREAKEGINVKDLAGLQGEEAEKLKARIEHGAVIMDQVSTLLVLLSMYDGAVETRQDEISFNTVLYGSVHDKISISCSELADVYEKVFCKYDISMELKTRALEIDKTLYGEENRQIAIGYDNLALLHLKLGNYTAAQEMYSKSLAIQEKLSGENSRDIAQTACALGLLYEELGQYDDAKEWYKKSLNIRIKAFGPAHPSVARSRIDLGMLLLKEGKEDIRTGALRLVQEGYNSLQATLGMTHTDVAAAANNLGLVYSQLGENSIALKFHLQAKKIQAARLGVDHPSYAVTCSNIGSVCQELAQEANRRGGEDTEENEYFHNAEDHYSTAILIYRVKMGEEHPELATTLLNLGTLHFDCACREAECANDFRQDLNRTKGENEQESLRHDCEEALDRYRENLESACKALDEAVAIRRKVFGEDHPSTAASIDSLNVCRDRLQRLDDSNGEDLGLHGNEADEEDLVALYSQDLEKLVEFLKPIFVNKVGSQGATLLCSAPGFQRVLDKFSMDLSIELPTTADIKDGQESLGFSDEKQLSVEDVAKLFQAILQAVYL